MEDRYYYKFKTIKNRKITLCVRLSLNSIQDMEAHVGIAIASPIDKFDITKGKKIALSRTKYNYKTRKPYIYKETVEQPFWKMLSFASYAERILDQVYMQVILNIERYIPIYQQTERI